MDLGSAIDSAKKNIYLTQAHTPDPLKQILTPLPPRSAWYLDLTGSGNETISHMQENGRITISQFRHWPHFDSLVSHREHTVFCAFEGPPRICRLYGTGRILERGTADFESLVSQLPAEESTFPGQRSIVWIDIHKVGTSCGYSVPFYDFKEER